METSDSEQTLPEEQYCDSPCPHCGQVVSYFGNAGGTFLECPACHTDLLVDPRTLTAQPVPTMVEAERLLLRRLRSSDIEDLLSLMGEPDSFQHIDWAPMDEEGIKQWLSEDERSRLSHPAGSLVLGVELRKERKLIGFIFLGRVYADPRQLQLVTLIHHDFRKQGFGTEATLAALKFAFQGVQSHRVIAHCDLENTAGIRMLEKSAMRREGEFYKDVWRDRRWISTVSFALVEEEFLKKE